MGIRKPLTVGVVFGLILACSSGLREDELGCEEAAAHLEECCDGVDASMFDCAFAPGTCGDSRPALLEDTSGCIRDKSCDELVTSGVCDGVRRGERRHLQCN